VVVNGRPVPEGERRWGQIEDEDEDENEDERED